MPTRGGGFLQGYNAQNVTSADGLIIATQLTRERGHRLVRADAHRRAGRRRPDHRAPAPARLAAPRTRQATTAPPGKGASSGCSSLMPGTAPRTTFTRPDRLIATGKHRDLEKRARAGGGPAGNPRNEATAAMTARLATEEGITAYRQRGHIAETPHGHIKHNMRFRQLTMRGKPKAAAEWAFAATVHNLFKAHYCQPPHPRNPGQPGIPARLTPASPAQQPAQPPSTGTPHRNRPPSSPTS